MMCQTKYIFKSTQSKAIILTLLNSLMQLFIKGIRLKTPL